jgi:hypothetical protein
MVEKLVWWVDLKVANLVDMKVLCSDYLRAEKMV